MTQKSLSALLKGLIVVVGLFGAALLAYVSRLMAYFYLESALYVVIFWVICIIPCYAVLVFSWRVASNIGRDKSFSYTNARLLKYNALLAACDTAFFALVSVVFCFMELFPDSAFLWLSVVIFFFGIAASIVFAALSHLVYKAAELQEQNDLTV